MGLRWGRRFVTSTQTPLPLALVSGLALVLELALALEPELALGPVPDSQ